MAEDGDPTEIDPDNAAEAQTIQGLGETSLRGSEAPGQDRVRERARLSPEQRAARNIGGTSLSGPLAPGGDEIESAGDIPARGAATVSTTPITDPKEAFDEGRATLGDADDRPLQKPSEGQSLKQARSRDVLGDADELSSTGEIGKPSAERTATNLNADSGPDAPRDSQSPADKLGDAAGEAAGAGLETAADGLRAAGIKDNSAEQEELTIPEQQQQAEIPEFEDGAPDNDTAIRRRVAAANEGIGTDQVSVERGEEQVSIAVRQQPDRQQLRQRIAGANEGVAAEDVQLQQTDDGLAISVEGGTDTEQFGDFPVTNPITGNRVEEDLEPLAQSFDEQVRGGTEAATRNPATAAQTIPFAPIFLAAHAESQGFEAVNANTERSIDEAALVDVEQREDGGTDVEGPLETSVEGGARGFATAINPASAALEGKEIAEFAATQPPRALEFGAATVRDEEPTGEAAEFEEDVERRVSATIDTTTETVRRDPVGAVAAAAGGLAAGAAAGTVAGRAISRIPGVSGSDLSGRALLGTARTVDRVTPGTRTTRTAGRRPDGDEALASQTDLPDERPVFDPTERSESSLRDFLDDDRGQVQVPRGRRRRRDEDLQSRSERRSVRGDRELLEGGPRDRASDRLTQRQLQQRRQLGGDFERRTDPVGRADGNTRTIDPDEPEVPTRRDVDEQLGQETQSDFFAGTGRRTGVAAGLLGATAAADLTRSGALLGRAELEQQEVGLQQQPIGQEDATLPFDSPARPSSRLDTAQRLDQELRLDSRVDTRQDLRQELRQDTRQDTRQDLRQELRQDTRQDTRQDLRLDLRQDFRQDLDLGDRRRTRGDEDDDLRLAFGGTETEANLANVAFGQGSLISDDSDTDADDLLPL